MYGIKDARHMQQEKKCVQLEVRWQAENNVSCMKAHDNKTMLQLL